MSSKSLLNHFSAATDHCSPALLTRWPMKCGCFFERKDIAACDCFETTDGDHGLIEVRRHKVSRDVSWLIIGQRFPGEPRFPAPAMVGMVEAKVERGGKISVARHPRPLGC